MSARELSLESRVPAPMVAKVLKLLGRSGLLQSQRGVHGGYALAQPAAKMTVLEVLEALEGPVALTDCSTDDGPSVCPDTSCPVRSPWQRINEAIREALSRVTLSEMTCPIGDPVGAFAGAQRSLPSTGNLNDE